MEVKMSDDYNTSGIIQYRLGRALSEELISTITEMNSKNPERFKNIYEPFIICDLGCSLGHSTVQFLKPIFT